jgi:transposase InsO family protein
MPRVGGKKLYYLLQPEMQKLGIRCGRDKFFKILRQERLLVKKRKNYTKTTQSYHRFNKHPNLVMDTTINRPEQVWVSDITYIKTRQGYMYLSLITDAYSKRIMGYELSDNMKTESTKRALKMALKNRKYPDMPLIHHSDRGIQYCNPDYTDVLEGNRIDISMTTKYDPYENAVAERVNGILKNEFIFERELSSMKEAKRVVNQTIGIYNYERPHLSCDYLTPAQAHDYGNYELKRWSKKNSSKGYPLEENEYYI